MDIVIERLETPVVSDDWHDPDLKWRVKGPGEEVQLFATRAWARDYRRARMTSVDQQSATKAFLAL